MNSKYGSATNLYAPFFETVIRYLGGLLAAYALSGEKIILDKADELGSLLEPAFNTGKGFPAFGINTARFVPCQTHSRRLTHRVPLSGQTTGGVSGILAEIASCQLEWTYLAHATGSKKHFDVVGIVERVTCVGTHVNLQGNNVLLALEDAMRHRKGGMFTTHWNLGTGRSSSGKSLLQPLLGP